jgi:ABC-2 type transport system permease protein/sodium transport system permease protein
MTAGEPPPENPVTLSPGHPVTLSSSLGRLWRLSRKELTESLRDRRTILTLVLMPLLLYPLLVIVFQQVMLAGKIEQQQPVYRVGFVSRVEARALFDYWLLGMNHRPPPWSDQEAMARFLAAHLQRGAVAPDEVDRLTLAFLEASLSIRPRYPADLEEAVRTGQVDVGLQLYPPGPFRARPDRPFNRGCLALLREGDAMGRDAFRHVEALTSRANVRLVSAVLALFLRIPQRADALRLGSQTLPDEALQKSLLVPVLVPLILILMTMTGAVYPAIDLTAGERERGTLEVLVAAPIPRLGLLFAKYVAVLTVAMLTALVNLGMMGLTLAVTGLGQQIFQDSFTPGVLVQILALLLLFAAFFSAVLLALTSFARSFKEAQAYLIPLMLLALLPGMLALMPGLSLQGPLAIVPLLNIVLLSRDLLAGSASPASAGVVILTTLVYATAAVALAARIFGTEAVLTSEQSGWADLFRRPARFRTVSHVSVPAALLCLALMFPVYFVLTTGLGRLEGLPLGARLALTAVGNVLLFAGLPLLFLWFARARLAAALRWRPPSVAACAVAGLLGVSLWPWTHELILVLRQVGLGSLRADYLERMARVLEEWRTLSPVALVLALAVVPAVMEELFFRGFLFSALAGEQGRAGAAILGSAGLFALFHVLVPGGLAVERLVSSLLMGLVLGWLAYASGSVVPGVLLHGLHNGLVVLAGYYKPTLVEAGWLSAAHEHLPGWLLLAAGAGAGLGALGVWRLRRGPS